MAYNWPEIRTVEKAKLLAENLPMQEYYNLTFDVFIRQKVDQGEATLFHGTDGVQPYFTTFRCGGRLPAIFVSPGDSDNQFRKGFLELLLSKSPDTFDFGDII